MRISPFGSLIVALVTPFDEALAVDYRAAGMLASKLVDEGCDGVVVSGTTGESPNLTAAEKIRLLAAVKDAVGGRAKVWAGTGGNNTRESVELTRAAEDAGADGILAVTPYYNKPSQDGLYLHFRAMSESTSLPVMLYNVPGRTSVNMVPDTVLRLSELSNVVAVKEASGSLDQSSQILSSCPQGFFVYSGDDSLTLPILAIGGSGIVSVAAHVVARRLRDMLDFYREGELQAAREIHLRLFQLFKVLFITTNPVPVKTALELCGTPMGGFRLPLCPPSERETAQIARVLVGLGLIRDPKKHS